MRCFELILALVCAGFSASAQTHNVTGQYVEDRSSRVYACPCEWSSDFVMAGREAVLAWNIQSGTFQGESLAGLRMAVVLVADYSLNVPQSSRRATLFVDQSAPMHQRRAAEAWLTARYGDLLGRVTSTHVVPIDFALTPDSVSLEIRDVLSLRMRRANLATDTETWGALIYEPFIELTSQTMGTPLRAKYSAPDQQRSWTRSEQMISGYYGTFAAR